MTEQVTIYSAIEQASDALERLMINSIASLERSIDMETDPSKLAFINEKIISSYEKLQKIKEKNASNSKVETIGIFEKTMQQLSVSPKLADKATKHKQLKSLMAQAEDFNIKTEDDEQND